MVIFWTRIYPNSLTCLQEWRGTVAPFDFNLDRWAQVFWETGSMDRLETGFVAEFGAGGWSSREIVQRDYSVRDRPAARQYEWPARSSCPSSCPPWWSTCGQGMAGKDVVSHL